MKKTIITTALLLTSYMCAANDFAKASFDRLSALAGTWQGSYQSGSTHNVEYKLLARGTVLVETWIMSPTSQSMTVYFYDGEKLFATHYCPQGNQPTLVLDEDKSADGKLHFSFVSGTGLENSKASHQYEVFVQLLPNGTFSRSENYRKNNDFSKVDIGENVTYQRVN